MQNKGHFAITAAWWWLSTVGCYIICKCGVGQISHSKPLSLPEILMTNSLKLLYITRHHHYNDVIMGTVASQITSLTIVYSTVIQTEIKENIKAPCHWSLCGEFTGICEFPAQWASNAENVSIWWRHHDRIKQHSEQINLKIITLANVGCLLKIEHMTYVHHFSHRVVYNIVLQLVVL